LRAILNSETLDLDRLAERLGRVVFAYTFVGPIEWRCWGATSRPAIYDVIRAEGFDDLPVRGSGALRWLAASLWPQGRRFRSRRIPRLPGIAYPPEEVGGTGACSEEVQLLSYLCRACRRAAR
jgi:hypothetical protein